jgi:hypothetical protein
MGNIAQNHLFSNGSLCPAHGPKCTWATKKLHMSPFGKSNKQMGSDFDWHESCARGHDVTLLYVQRWLLVAAHFFGQRADGTSWQKQQLQKGASSSAWPDNE